MVFLYRSPTRRQANKSEFIPPLPAKYVRRVPSRVCPPRAISNRSFEELLLSLSLYPSPGEKLRLKGSWRFFENTRFLFFEEAEAEVSLDMDGQRASPPGPFNVNDPASFALEAFLSTSFKYYFGVYMYISVFQGVFFFLFSRRFNKRSVDETLFRRKRKEIEIRFSRIKLSEQLVGSYLSSRSIKYSFLPPALIIRAETLVTPFVHSP